MAGNEKEFKGITIGEYTSKDTQKLGKDLHKHVNNDVIFFCVGTDRSTGDSFAPLVGTMLKENGYENVIGTLDDLVHAKNIGERVNEIPEGKTVIAIDACLGRVRNIGKLILNSGALYAGKGVGKELPPVGDYHIQGIVNVDSNSDYMNFKALSSTKLSTVIKMAKETVKGIEQAFPLVIVETDKLKLIK